MFQKSSMWKIRGAGSSGLTRTPTDHVGHGGPVGAVLWHTMICQPELMDVIPSHQSKDTSG